MLGAAIDDVLRVQSDPAMHLRPVSVEVGRDVLESPLAYDIAGVARIPIGRDADEGRCIPGNEHRLPGMIGHAVGKSHGFLSSQRSIWRSAQSLPEPCVG